MKIKTLYILHLILCYGCKVNKEKSERIQTDSQSQSSLEKNTSWIQFNNWDSSYRYWHYAGDSSFFFHPDAGLWGHSGQLTYGEKLAVQRQETAITHHYDSLGIENNRTVKQTQVKTLRKAGGAWFWLGLIILALLLIYVFRRRK